jgi:carotenoid cleavage dioxygenase
MSTTAETETSSPWLSGNYAPVTEEVTAFDLPVTGTIPEGLDGRYVRNGPNPRGVEDPATHHWFLGDGMLHGVRLRDGRAEWYRNRWVADGAGGPNTHVISQAGRTWALVESGPVPVEVSDELEPTGTTAFDGTLRDGYTAHTKRDPRTGELHAVSYFWGWGDQLHYSVVGTDGLVRREIEIPVPGQPMVHDCAITEDHVVLLDLPVTFDLDQAMAGGKLPYGWDPDYGARVGLLPFEAEADAVQWFDVELGYVFHSLNAYVDTDGTVVLDVVRHEKVFDRERTGPTEGAPRLERWTLDPATGRAAARVVDGDITIEMPRHDERLLGRRHRYGYAIASWETGEHGAGSKYDLQTDTVERRSFGPGRITDEMTFVPRSPDAGEDEGWLLSYVYDQAEDATDLVILAADDFTGDPVATVRLPQRVPFGFHGNWMPTGI